MMRSEAIALLVNEQLISLGKDERESLMLDWWGMDDDDEDFLELPEVLRSEMRRREAPEGTHEPHHDALLRVALRRRFIGVRNDYLARRLASLGYENVVVEGNIEKLEACPCCDFRTLSARGSYEICPVCYWEDDGGEDLERMSFPNHMTLREGRGNLEMFGASSERMVPNVLPDGKDRYEHA